MKRYFLGAIAAAAGISLLSPVSQANCVATGTIPRIFLQTAAPTNIGVRDNGAATTFFNFTTSNLAAVNAAVAAEASHMTVQITGNAAACGAVFGGVSAGGTVLSILLSP